MNQAPSTLPDTPQHSLGLSILLHLAPGILTGFVFFVTAPFVEAMRLPSFLALCFADVAVLVPLILGYLLYHGYKTHGAPSLRGIVLYRSPLPPSQYAMLAPLIFVASAALIVALTPISTWIFDAWFSWVPETYLITPDLSRFSRATLVVSYLLFFVVIVVAVPIVEELYFRGYLLPRLSHYGRWAPLLHSALFALFHAWTPWLAVARTIGLLPLILIVSRKRNIYVGMIAHMLANSIDVLTGVLFILSNF